MSHSRILFMALCLASSVIAASVSADTTTWTPPESFTSLTAHPALPDVFTFENGRKVETRADWERRREEIKAMLQYYQYGHIPPRPDRVIAAASSRGTHESGLGILEEVTLEIDSVKKLRFQVALYLPEHEGPRPVILRDSGYPGHSGEASMFLEKGYIFVEYGAPDLDPDRDRVIGAAQAAYPNHDWATLAVWAWGAMRVVDYLETRDDIDLTRVGITGHSRSGKMALLAAALDERISFAAPHQSGSGGAGCYRVLSPGAETLAQNDKPHWYHGRIRWFGEQEERLPFDQHFLKALVAPRALLCTESIDDEFANPLGTLVTSVAAQEVFEFLGVPEKNGIHFRRGNHSTRSEDIERLLEFAEWHFFNRPPADRMKYWRAPFALPSEFDAGKVRRPIGLTVETRDGEQKFSAPPAATADAPFVTVDQPDNAPDRDHHGQGQYGAVPVSFEIGTREVSHIAYARFLNAVAKQDPGALYHPAMAKGTGCIRREEAASGFQYSILQGEAPTPVTHVDWYDAVRYCNWVHNGRPVGPQDSTSTEDGAYSLAHADEAVVRKRGAKCFLPSEDEWYKSAYYDADSDKRGHYRHFSERGSDRPLLRRPRPERVSPLGMAGFADQIWEWTETPVGTLHRGLRSGAWFLGNNRQAAGRFYSNPEMEYPSIGFRVARP